MVSKATQRGRQSLGSVVAAGVLAYLIGSVPSADLVSRWAARRTGEAVDLRRAGTRNPGAMNAIGVLGPTWGSMVLVADIAKGAIASWFGRRIAGPKGAYIAGTAAVLGHCAPVWSGFRGGKGVATSAGTCLVCFPAYAPIDVGVAVGIFRLSRGHVELATYAASACFVTAATYWWLKEKRNLWGPQPTFGLPLYALATSALIAYRFLAPTATSGSEQRSRPGGQSGEREITAVA